MDYRAPRQSPEASTRLARLLQRVGATCSAAAHTVAWVVIAAAVTAAGILLLKFVCLQALELWPRVNQWVF